MKVIFCRSNDIGGWLIRLFTWSDWNHVVIEIDGVMFDATIQNGVAAWNANTYKWDKMKSVDVNIDNKTAVKSFLQNQLGKKYDWMALLALPFRTTWQSPYKWFCSELVAKALVVGGYDKLNKRSYRITPQDLWEELRP